MHIKRVPVLLMLIFVCACGNGNVTSNSRELGPSSITDFQVDPGDQQLQQLSLLLDLNCGVELSDENNPCTQICEILSLPPYGGRVGWTMIHRYQTLYQQMEKDGQDPPLLLVNINKHCVPLFES